MTGNEPNYITAIPNAFNSTMSFETLVEMSEKMSAANPGTMESNWQRIGTETQAEVEDFTADFINTIKSGWTGQSADAATSSVTAYAKANDNLSAEFKAVANTLGSVVASVDAVRNTVSGIPEYIPKGGFVNSATWWDTDTEKEYYRRHNQARQAVERYGENLHTAETPVPQFPDLKEALVPPATGSGSGGGSYGGGSYGGGGNPGGGSSLGDQRGDNPELDASTETNDAAGQQDPSTQASSQSGDYGLGETGTDTRLGEPAGTSAMSAGAPSGTGTGGFGGGGGSGVGAGAGAGSGGIGSGGGTGPALSGPNPGSGVPGSGLPSGTGGAGTGAGGGAGARGGGMAGGPMMGAGGAGAGRGGDQEKEHRAPDYLVHPANAHELLGDPPPVSPSVIGA